MLLVDFGTKDDLLVLGDAGIFGVWIPEFAFGIKMAYLSEWIICH